MVTLCYKIAHWHLHNVLLLDIVEKYDKLQLEGMICIMKNEYYDIAYNNLLFLMTNSNSNFYNHIAIFCQQTAETMLKSVLDEISDSRDNNINRLMRSSDLRVLYNQIHKVIPEFVLDRSDLAMLTDYYYSARYPGDNFVTVTKEESDECLKVTLEVVEQVNRFRKANGLEVKEISHEQLNGMQIF